MHRSIVQRTGRAHQPRSELVPLCAQSPTSCASLLKLVVRDTRLPHVVRLPHMVAADAKHEELALMKAHASRTTGGTRHASGSAGFLMARERVNERDGLCCCLLRGQVVMSGGLGEVAQ